MRDVIIRLLDTQMIRSSQYRLIPSLQSMIDIFILSTGSEEKSRKELIGRNNEQTLWLKGGLHCVPGNIFGASQCLREALQVLSGLTQSLKGGHARLRFSNWARCIRSSIPSMANGEQPGRGPGTFRDHSYGSRGHSRAISKSRDIRLQS